MRLTIYAYPWDLARVGVERSLRQIAGDGISAIDLAATYHPIDALSPRGGAAIFSDARGAVYFPPRQKFYGRIQPKVHSPQVSAVWPEVAAQASALGVDLNAWTITLFQPWIRDAYPDTARVFPTGDRSGSAVCAANEDVREFFVALCRDMVEQFGISLVRLENIMPIFDFDWLRPRVLVTLSALARTLMNLCFCEACSGRALNHGLDLDHVRRLVKEGIDAELEDGANNVAHAASFTDDVQLRAFVELAMCASTELVATIRASISPKARVSINAAASYEAVIGIAREQELLAEFIAAADQIALLPGHSGNAQVAALAAKATPPREISALIPIVRAANHSGPALQARVSDPEVMAEQALLLGAGELSLYNFGLLRARDISAFASGIRS